MKKYSQYFGWLMGAVGTVLGVVGIVDFFETESVWFKVILIAVVFVAIAVVAIVLSVIAQRRDQNLEEGFIGDRSIMVQENKRYLTSMYKNHEYNDVCNIGAVFSRVFYIAAAYQSRYAVSMMVFKSADYLNRHKLCATTLLDLGWTALLLGKNKFKCFEHNGVQYDSPDDFFHQSIIYAEKIQDHALISKANRHISGYYLTLGDFAEAMKYRKLSEDFLNKMPEGTDKAALYANLIYADAETAFLQKKYQEALKLCIKADRLKQGVDEETREIRYYAQRGKIELMLKNVTEAANMFTKGLECAKRLKRLDEVTKNTYGYAICLILNGQKHDAESSIKHLIKAYGDIPLFVSDEFFKTEYRRILIKHNGEDK